MTQKAWDRALTASVAEEIRRGRGKHSVQWLSDRTADCGHRVSRSRISDLEAGLRGGVLGLAELLVLAEALGAKPMDLLFPHGQTVDALPGKPHTSAEARERFTGEQSASATLAAIRSLM